MPLPRIVDKLRKSLFRGRELSSSAFIVLLSAFLLVFANATFFSNVLDAFPLAWGTAPFLLSLGWVFAAISVVGLSLVCSRFTTKPIAIALLLISSVTSYFMDSYNTLIDDSMIDNMVRTDTAEVLDLMSLRLVLYVLFLGVLPSVFVATSTITYRPGWREMVPRAKLFGIAIGSILLVALPLSSHYASFLRQHKALRYYSNPGCFIYATSKYVAARTRSGVAPLKQIGLDARIEREGTSRKLVIMVVGESARADRFSLNGYERETNPILATKDVISFSDFWSYGTSTAVSVPFMFALGDSSDYDAVEAESTENVLDVMQRAGVDILWLDNNSSSKGVADRVPYQTYKKPSINPICDPECRDEGMLAHLQPHVDERPNGDLLIVLHQMGNHGPAYYKRYPKRFERFTPIRRTNQLQDCTDEEIGNAYDNTILYTDYFLSKVIDFLAANDDEFDVAMLYISDHGESLGENGVYLHGLPTFIAPDAQQHVPAIFWFGDGFSGVERSTVERKRDREFSHDIISHSLLGLLDVQTSVYDRKLDLFRRKK